MLLNQDPFDLKPPVRWRKSPTADPLWAFRLHGWEWAWSAVADASQKRPQFFALWDDWLTYVPFASGPAWEPHPVSKRLVVWCTAWHLLGGIGKHLTSIARHASYLSSHLERDLDNNHLVANGRALAWAGLLFSDLPGASRWQRKGLQTLWNSLREQVAADGGHVERSSTYHVDVWLDGLETALLCRALEQPVPLDVLTILEGMGEFALALRRPDGRLPLLNDSVEDEPLPLVSAFRSAVRLWPRPDFEWAAGYNDIVQTTAESRALAESGYVVVRQGSVREGLYLIFDVGDLGPVHCPGHGHADALSFELWSKGEPLVIDPGTYQYSAGKWREYFRSTAAHSTATVDGVNQSEFAGSFRLAHMARGRLLDLRVASDEVEIVGEHDGYSRLDDAVFHRRRLHSANDQILRISDSFKGRGQHSIALRFHLAPCDVRMNGINCAEMTYPGGTRLIVTVTGTKDPELEIEDGWYSRAWYEKVKTPVLKCAMAVQLPITIETELRIT